MDLLEGGLLCTDYNRYSCESILSSLLDQIDMTEEITCYVVQLVIYTRFDPCPFCMNRIYDYCSNKLIEQVQSSLGLDKDIYVLPIVASRSGYQYKKGIVVREVMPYKKSIDLEDFRLVIAQSDESNDEEQAPPVQFQVGKNYGLILYAIPFLSLQMTIASCEAEPTQS